MNKKKIVLTIIILLLIAFAYWFKGWLDVDKCLDAGGRWNYEKFICEYK